MTSGLSSLKDIPDESVDVVFSQAVFEHIRKKDFLPTLKELHRILKPTGSSSHEIDLRDHLGGSLNSLRFSNLIRESDFFTKSGFYTNRIRFSEMLDLFEKIGFQFKIIDKVNWAKLPIARKKLHRKFRQLSEQNLSVACFVVSLTR
ncbi:class I SAM-dependent methyltransferase [bacterium]|nr:class I SAM-dependent methyltransferase [bacterium]